MTDVTRLVVRSEGLGIHAEIHGEARHEGGAGVPVVLVHGWGATFHSNWMAPGWVADLVAAGHRVVGIDLRGHGTSDKPHDRSRYGYAAMSHDVLAVLDHLDIAEAVMVGYSLGAFSAVHLLGHHHDRVAAAVLIGIGDETPESAAVAPRIAAALRAETVDDIDDPLGRAYRRFVDADPTHDREALALAALEMWRQGHPLDIGGPGLATADVPVLVLNGADDLPYVLSDERLVAALPRAQLVRVPGADHLAGVHDPRFREHVLEFLDGLEAPR